MLTGLGIHRRFLSASPFLRDPSLSRFQAELMARGFTDDELKGILGGNVLRVWAATEAASAKLKAAGALPSTARLDDPE